MNLIFDDQRQWFKVFEINALLDILSKSAKVAYMLVAGDTAHGQYIYRTLAKIVDNKKKKDNNNNRYVLYYLRERSI